MRAKFAVETALGLRPKMQVFGTDYSTPDGTCIRDYIHVSDLVAAHSDALAYLRGGGASTTLNCGYGHGFSVLEVIESVKHMSGVDFKVELAPRRPGDPAQSWPPATSSVPRWDGSRALTTCKPSSPTRWHGNAGFPRARANCKGRQPGPRMGSRSRTAPDSNRRWIKVGATACLIAGAFGIPFRA
jgi:UDP-glucose 4-epimerase